MARPGGREPVVTWAADYDALVDRHGPLLAAAVGRCLTGIWTPERGLGRRHPRSWRTNAPLLLDFDGLRLEFEFSVRSRSVVHATGGPADPVDGADAEPWYRLGSAPDDPAALTTFVGQRLWAVDLLERVGGEYDLGFAFGSGYLAMTASCCCTLILSGSAPPLRRLRLASAAPTREGFPPRGVLAPRGTPAWSGCD